MYNGTPQAELFIGLSALETDTVPVQWFTGDVPATGLLTAQCLLFSDSVPSNDSLSVPLTILPAAMRGLYSIGEGRDYPNFNSAVNDLISRGISGGVIFDVFGGEFSEPVLVGAIDGSSAFDSVVFRRAPSQSTPVLFSTSDTGPATLVYSGCSYVTFRGIDLSAVAPNVNACLFTQGASHNALASCTVSSSSLQQVSACGIGSTGGGNSFNRIDSVRIGHGYYGIRLQGTSARPDVGNSVASCTILSSRVGLRTDWQNQCELLGNTVNTGYEDAVAPCCGISLGSQGIGTTVTVARNNITGARGFSTFTAIECEAELGAVEIRNNFVSDFSISGTGAVYGIYLSSGYPEIRFNSLSLNDIDGSGTVTGIAITGSTVIADLFNNVIANAENQNVSCAIQWQSGSLRSDYNAISMPDSNPNFHFGLSPSGPPSPEWDAWRAATWLDSHSVVGEPGFVSQRDLHIRPNSTLLAHAGIMQDGVTADFDGDARTDPPDIGADEYSWSVVAADYAVEWISPPAATYRSDSLFAIRALVTNLGSVDQSNGSVFLRFNHGLCDSVRVDLTAGEADTVTFYWQTPDTTLLTGELTVNCVLPGDQVPGDDSIFVQASVVGAPMHGTYSIRGAAPSFPDFTSAATSLELRGVNGRVVMMVSPGIYQESVTLHAVAGSGESNGISFTTQSGGATLTSPVGNAVLTLRGADFVTFETIDIVATGSCAYGVILAAGSNSNCFSDCRIRGADSSRANTYGVLVQTDSNNTNLFKGVIVSGAYTGIAFGESPAPTIQCTGNQVFACTILHARYSLHVDNQINCLIFGNDIQPGAPTTLAAPCYGVYITSLGAGGSVTVSGNRIHHFADHSDLSLNRAVGIYCAAAHGGTVTACNNFIYDFDEVLRLKRDAIYLSAGANYIWNNSILLGNSQNTTENCGIYISTGGEHSILNNILMSEDSATVSYGILQNGGGGFVSDYNDIFGLHPQFHIGKVRAAEFAGFTKWQDSGYDLHGLSADPKFVARSDLHVQVSSAVVDGRGLWLDSVLTDIDGDTRGQSPDIGADEYTVNITPPAVTDLTITATDSVVVLCWSSAPGATAYHIYAGSAADLYPDPSFYVATVSTNSYTDSAAPDLPRRYYLIIAEVGAPAGRRDRKAPQHDEFTVRSAQITGELTGRLSLPGSLDTCNDEQWRRICFVRPQNRLLSAPWVCIFHCLMQPMA